MAKKRASKGSGTQPRKRPDGRWEARFSCGIDPATGKTITRYIYGKTSAEAATKLRKATAEVDSGDYITPDKTKLSEWLDIWLSQYCNGIKPGTVVQYQGYITNHIKPALGAMPLNKIQPHHVQKMVNGLTGHGRGRDTISYKTRKNVHGCLSAALGKAVELHYMRENPAKGCSIPRDNDVADTKEIHPFTTEEIKAFLPLAEKSRYYGIYFVALNTGMRLSEILGLRWSCVDFSSSRITVNAQLLVQRHAGEKKKLGQPKNRKARTFKAAPQVMEVLRDTQKAQSLLRLRAGALWNNEFDLVFTDELGRPVSHSSLGHDFNRHILAEMGVHHRFHDLRHTFATEALRNGIDYKTLSDTLGHFSAAFTMDVYAHVTEEMQNTLADIMGRVIASRNG